MVRAELCKMNFEIYKDVLEVNLGMINTSDNQLHFSELAL